MASFETQTTCSLAMKTSLFLLLMASNLVNPVSFNFTSFKPNTLDITFQGDAFQSNGVLQLTKNQALGSLGSSAGRASYSSPIPLWDPSTRRLADFSTRFTFLINATDLSAGNGDGISFFLAAFDSDVPANSTGGFLALFSPETAFNSSAGPTNRVVAVEFDTFDNDWDFSSDHVGIDVGSIVSVKNVTWKTSMKSGALASAWVSYNSSTMNLSVFLTYAENPVFEGQNSLFHIVDLREFLPQEVRVGFSASTGTFAEIHNILSWSFNSTLEIKDEIKRTNRLGLWAGLSAGFGVLVFVLGLVWFACRGKTAQKEEEYSHKRGNNDYASIDNEFEKGTWPKRFSYKELSEATNGFVEEKKLGEGGFGGVYKGQLSDHSNREVAVKRVSRGSKQGKKEYMSEVKIISRLRHRNLVQLIGWCHEQGDLVLVYEFLPNGSLDSHLFGDCTKALAWHVRHKIALGLASALLYLHEEWEQCVVHRDIKPSNVMLDSNFNAKLGDFGLARLVDHGELGSQPTAVAGTMGYLAPECVTLGAASKESDVYSFGVVALEVCCGRRPIDPIADPSEARLVEWVWELYGKGKTLDALDKGLRNGGDMDEFEERQMECLMVVGLWCCHPDPAARPSVRQAISVLNFEASLPRLPARLPVPMYFAPPMEMCRFSYSWPGRECSVISSYTRVTTYSSSTSGGSSKTLLT